jgi:hypothetical protein
MFDKYKHRLIICVPQRWHIGYNAFWKSVLKAVIVTNNSNNVRVLDIYTVERKVDDDSRNIMVNEILKTDCTHVLFLDDDHVIGKNDIINAVYSDIDVLGGLYFDRQYPHYPNVFKKDDEGYMCRWYGGVNCGLQEVDAIGTGFVLVKKSVFEKMEFPWFKWHEQVEGLKVTEKDVIGCDVVFSVKAHNLGFKVVCDTNMVIDHIGADTTINAENGFRG